MPEDAIIHLDQLRCISEFDQSGHSEPYVWPVLVYTSDATFASGQTIRTLAPATSVGFRAVVKEGMRAGDVVPIPAVQQTLAVRFDDGLFFRSVSLVVAMFEEDETPSDAARAAYSEFVVAFRETLEEFVDGNGRAPDLSNPDEIDPIVEAVRARVKAAGRSELSWWEKLQIGVGSLDLDTELGFQLWSPPGVAGDPAALVPAPFTLQFRKEVFGGLGNLANEYELDGRFEVRGVPIDLCATEAERVQRARDAISGVQSMISSLQAELQGSSPSGKAAILAEIRRIREEELPGAVAELDAAQGALDQCRLHAGGHHWGDVVLHGDVFQPVFG